MSRCTMRWAWAWATALDHVADEPDARLDPEAPRIAVLVDRLAVHVLEDQVELAGRRDARVDEVRDVRVGEAGEDADLAPEASFAGAAHEARVQDLHRHLPLEAAVGALREPDAPHASLPDVRGDPVGAEGLADQRSRGQDGGSVEEARSAQEAALLEERHEVGGEGRVLGP